MYIAIIVIASVALILLLLSYAAFRQAFLSIRKKHATLYHGLGGEETEIKRKRREIIDRMKDMPFEDVEITSRDGKRLHARYYHVSDNAPIAIQMHGYKSLAQRDFSGGAYECINIGQNVLLPDQRAHGESSGRVITFGIKERYDVLDWIDYAINRFGADRKIILYGISMGAATVLMASELELPRNVIGAVADCPYSDIKKIIVKVLGDMKLPPKLVYPFVWLGARIYGGFNINSASPLRAVANTKLPILLIHGDEDHFVPVHMSDELAKAGKTVTYLKVPGATHGLSMVYDRDGYMKAVKDFLNTILNNSEDKTENEDK